MNEKESNNEQTTSNNSELRITNGLTIKEKILVVLAILLTIVQIPYVYYLNSREKTINEEKQDTIRNDENEIDDIEENDDYEPTPEEKKAKDSDNGVAQADSNDNDSNQDSDKEVFSQTTDNYKRVDVLLRTGEGYQIENYYIQAERIETEPEEVVYLSIKKCLNNRCETIKKALTTDEPRTRIDGMTIYFGYYHYPTEKAYIMIETRY